MGNSRINPDSNIKEKSEITRPKTQKKNFNFPQLTTNNQRINNSNTPKINKNKEEFITKLTPQIVNLKPLELNRIDDKEKDYKNSNRLYDRLKREGKIKDSETQTEEIFFKM